MGRVGAQAPGPAVQPSSVASVGLRAPPSSTATIDDQQAAELLAARNKQREDAQQPRVLSAREAAVHRLTQAYCQYMRREFMIECSGELATLEESDVNDLFTATVVRLKADRGPEQVHLLIETANRWDTVLLAKNYSSGVGGFSHSITVTHDEAAAPSLWVGVVENESHDSDLGECRVTADSARDWVVCGLQDGQPCCAQVPLARESFEDVSSMLEREPDCAPPRVTREGFSRLANFDGTRLSFKRDPLAQFSARKKAPANEALTLEQLFALHRLPSSQR